VIGTILNTVGILAGGIAGLARKAPVSAPTQHFFKVALGAFTVFYGLRLTWISLNGSFLQVLKQLGIVILALMLGKLTGRLLRLQKSSNRLGQYARERMAAAQPGNPRRLSDGFITCAALFCAAPLGILGAVHDGVSGYFYALGIKAVMDGLGAMGFISIFGPGVLLSALPVMAFQGTITLLCAQYARPFLEQHALVDSVNATGGLLIFCVALIIFEIKKIEIAGYLPSLAFAPLLTWLFR
jgi:uncharacterized protein